MNPALSRFLFRSATSVPATVPCRRLPATFPFQKSYYSSHSPVSPNTTPPRKKVTINTLRTMHVNRVPIAMMTAHDFPSGLAADQAHMDVILIGDSLAMVGLGMEVCHKPSLACFCVSCHVLKHGVVGYESIKIGCNNFCRTLSLKKKKLLTNFFVRICYTIVARFQELLSQLLRWIIPQTLEL